MYVQNEQLLREKITKVLLKDLFLGTGVSSSDFLTLPFEKQCEFYKTNRWLVVSIFQALGNSLPDDVAAPA
jgi:Ca2+/Na+ antiporter